jgi:hypothetical protein
VNDEQAGVKQENIDETEQFRQFGLRAVEPSKAATARMIALTVVWTFTGFLTFSFGIGLYILKRSPNIDEKSVSMAMEFLKVSTTLFSPLLAFVLGYYFSKREE